MNVNEILLKRRMALVGREGDEAIRKNNHARITD